MSRCICCKRKDECGCFPEAGTSSSYDKPVMCDEGHPAGCRDEDGWGACRWCADLSALRAVLSDLRAIGTLCGQREDESPLEAVEQVTRERDALRVHYDAAGRGRKPAADPAPALEDYDPAPAIAKVRQALRD